MKTLQATTAGAKTAQGKNTSNVTHLETAGTSLRPVTDRFQVAVYNGNTLISTSVRYVGQHADGTVMVKYGPKWYATQAGTDPSKTGLDWIDISKGSKEFSV